MNDELNWTEDDSLDSELPDDEMLPAAAIAPVSVRDDRIVGWHGRPGAEISVGNVFAALKDVHIDTRHYHRHAMALISATMALLPSDPAGHPALQADADDLDEARARARQELCESITHVRTLVGETLRYMSEEFKGRVDSEAERAGVWMADEAEKAEVRRAREEG